MVAVGFSSATFSRRLLAQTGPRGWSCFQAPGRRTLVGSAPRLGGHRSLARPDHKTLALDDLNQFRNILGSRPGAVLSSLENDELRTDPSDLEAFNVDWMGKYRGHSKVVLKPKSTEEVSRIVSYCVKNRLAICPQGGNTGLVGGSVPVFDEIILNLSGLNKIRNFDQTSGIISVDAGCILQTVDDFLKEKGFIFPLDLGAKGSCQVGGNIATNAGGLRLLRYGSLHGSVLGLEVVLPDQEGTILSSGMKTGLRKDNTGYDLKQLFIGSEGTLGVITGATILTPSQTRARFIEHGLLAPDGSEGDLLRGVVGYGHIGDGNLHLNVIAKKWDPRIEEVLEPWIYEKISSHNGSISAEHGLGLMKSPYLHYSQPPSNISLMKSIKHLFDPLNILNPSKFLP
ncbi:D-lactate dehydrogenase (cytochrome) [Puccinia graminis f. sp. tritici CRL 75-36-700-3]|uniref:D-lactate dehydrogenase (Cytochrome) n=1 Tax=Puccinia graminis f. sp. tritici (strain CRL 75-36-700-3 / race SCCL) TaxID=418459 RepID=E3K6E0_PUCGT|nr:D-lactate dehydrogenase (cytochrome) [Puccinia graminis f. sp. tritici CRL 75-36-700-3]EFP79871.2 D-lactate dehydrogenase (cytochrome) [Puccinia graminis f. sp. tritici CRL 75-36-700-3]